MPPAIRVQLYTIILIYWVCVYQFQLHYMNHMFIYPFQITLLWFTSKDVFCEDWPSCPPVWHWCTAWWLPPLPTGHWTGRHSTLHQAVTLAAGGDGGSQWPQSVLARDTDHSAEWVTHRGQQGGTRPLDNTVTTGEWSTECRGELTSSQWSGDHWDPRAETRDWDTGDSCPRHQPQDLTVRVRSEWPEWW